MVILECYFMILLILLVREFETRRGEMSFLFFGGKGSTAESAYFDSVGKHESTRVDEGRKS